MEVAVVTTTFDRETGEVLDKRITGFEKMDEEDYYKPLVEILYRYVMLRYEKEREETEGQKQAI